ncbi:MAG: SurA N-terminal domain-containing protein [Bacteroidales bacterium]|jgi:peptidyl-prolyl cis-trans isomerase D|nr:SurA N-terminal domain-containing protein [Bacteroidales bacterium]
MAVISKIRKHSGFLVAIIGISILGFVIQDMSKNSNTIPSFAVINGKDVRYDDFQLRVDELTKRYQQAQGPDVPLSPEDQEQIRVMAWQQLMNEIILESSYNKLGITVSTEEMNDMYYGTFISPYIRNMFTDPATGVFNNQQVINIIQNFDQLSPEDKKTLNDVEKAVKSERQREKYLTLLYKSYYVPSEFAKAIAHKQMDVRTSEYIMLSYVDMQDPDIDDSDYKKFYNKNKYMFQQPEETRTIDFVVFNILPTESDMEDIEKRVEEFYQDLKSIPAEEVQDYVNSVSPIRFDSIYKKRSEIYAGWDSALFNAKPGTIFPPKKMQTSYQMARLLDVQMRPDSLHAAHILIAYQGTANNNVTRTKDEAKHLADSLLSVVRRYNSPQAFMSIAAQNSDDPSAQQNSGDLGWMREGTFIKAFNDAMLKGAVGSYTVVETPYGYHILYIAGKTTPVKKVLAAVISVPIEASNETDKAVYAEASKFNAECKEAGMMDSLARKHGQFKRSAPGTDIMASSLAGLQQAREIIRWAYNEKTKAGDMASQIFSIDNNVYVIAALKEINKKGYMPIEQAKQLPAVTYAVTRNKKAELLKEKLNKYAAGETNLYSVYQKIYAEDTLVSYDTVYNLTFNSRMYGQGSMENDVIGSVFGLRTDKISKAIQGFSGVYLLNVSSSETANPESMIYPIKMQLEQGFMQGLQQNVGTALQKLADIDDNRWFYY